MTEYCFYCHGIADFMLDDDTCICGACWDNMDEDTREYHGGISTELTNE